MRFSLVLSLLRPVGPVVVGVSLGFTLSLLSVTWVEEPCGPSQGSLRDGGVEQPQQQQGGQGNAARKPNSVPAGVGMEPGQSWEPRVLPYKPPNPGKTAKKTIRYLWGNESNVEGRVCAAGDTRYVLLSCGNLCKASCDSVLIILSQFLSLYVFLVHCFLACFTVLGSVGIIFHYATGVQ